MGDQNLFTELKNLSPFPRTDVAKLGSTRKISGIYIEKSRKIDFFKTVLSAFKNNVSHFGKMTYSHIFSHKVAKNAAMYFPLHIPIIF